MANEWRNTSLGELTDWASGATPPKENPEYWGGDIPWISASSMKSGRLSESDRMLTQKGLEQRSKLARKNDVLLLVRGSELHKRIPVGVATRDVAFNQDVKALRTKNGINSTYLYYWLAANEPMLLLKVEHTGIGAGKLDTTVLKNLCIQVPPTEEQRAIAHILGTLDDKIELNRRMNETLQTMARALFKAWFVDFDGVSPQDMQESELGMIPKGWRVASLDSIADYLNGLALQKFPPSSEIEFLPVIKIAQLRTGNTLGADKASARLKPEYIVEDGDVLFSWSGSLEVKVWTGGRGALNQHLFKVTSSKVPKWFYYYSTHQHLPDFRTIAASKATTMGHIQRKHLSDAKIAVPPPDVMDKRNNIIAPIFSQIVNNAMQSQTLAQLRDTLLPKLISGALRVKDAERCVGEAL